MKASQSDQRRASARGGLGAAIFLAGSLVGFAPALGNETKATEFRLSNGLQVVVIPDHRLPLATQGIWYRVGASDDPPKLSGLAHFLEHLMFKGTARYPTGSFNTLLDSVGGVQNATTDDDVTAYFQVLPKNRLELVMAMEADRMLGLQVDDAEVATERNVVLEERKMRVDNVPNAGLFLKLRQAMYPEHAYFRHPIGSEEEIKSYTRDDAMRFYRQWYRPGNAVVVISGDITVEDARALVEKTYGKIPAGDPVPERAALRPLAPITVHRVAHTHERVIRPGIVRNYRLPREEDLQPGDAEALTLLGAILGSDTGRLYRRMVIEQDHASGVSSHYSWNLASGEFSIGIDAAEKTTAAQIEAGMDDLLAELKKDGITADELDLERNAFQRQYVISKDSQAMSVAGYGSWIGRGKTIADVEGWLERLDKVTVEDVNRVARKYLEPASAVTGELIPARAPKPNTP